MRDYLYDVTAAVAAARMLAVTEDPAEKAEYRARLDAATARIRPFAPLGGRPGGGHAHCYAVLVDAETSRAQGDGRGRRHRRRRAAGLRPARRNRHARDRGRGQLPIVRNSELAGTLRLEFAASPDDGRLAVLRLLSPQMAISLENARLYAGLEAQVAERSAESAFIDGPR